MLFSIEEPLLLLALRIFSRLCRTEKALRFCACNCRDLLLFYPLAFVEATSCGGIKARHSFLFLLFAYCSAVFCGWKQLHTLRLELRFATPRG
jgi:hypothetical protein